MWLRQMRKQLSKQWGFWGFIRVFRVFEGSQGSQGFEGFECIKGEWGFIVTVDIIWQYDCVIVSGVIAFG